MKKMEGIKSVDIKINASGHGVVNWNGTFEARNDINKNSKGEYQNVKNHALPKLRGFNLKPYDGIDKNGNKYKGVFKISQVDFTETPLYISQNCLRHHIFKQYQFDRVRTIPNIKEILPSVVGLVRGYVKAGEFGRKSPLLVEDLVELTGNGNLETFTTSGEKNENSLFTKYTFGDTVYEGYASINIEDLQFIQLGGDYGMQAISVTEKDALQLAENITTFIKTLDTSGKKNPIATFGLYTRRCTVIPTKMTGILLNDDAIDLLVSHVIKMIEDTYIQQGKGNMFVDSVTVDYNDSNRPMRIKRDGVHHTKMSEYAKYFTG